MTFIARYRGRCFICEEGIEPGDEAIYTDDDELAHPMCEDRGEPPHKRPQEVCGDCFIVKPCFC